jgi:hypothetical protein
MTDPREAELRDRVRTILAANRELGSRYEDAAVDQIVDLLHGRIPRAPKARPVPTPPPPPVRTSWLLSPFGALVAVAALILIGIPALRVTLGLVTGMVDVLGWLIFGLVCVYLITLFKRATRGWDRPHWRDSWDRREWEDERGHRWRRLY